MVAVGVAAGVCVSGLPVAGAAGVDFLPWPLPVWGGEVSQPDRGVHKTTSDGWGLHVEKSGERVFLAPALDGSVTTGQTYGSMNFRAWIDGQGEPELDAMSFEAGYQIGCGVSIPGGVDAELAGALGSSPTMRLGGEAGPSVSVKLPNVQGVDVSADARGKAEVGVDGKAEVAPTVSAHLEPGAITNVVLVDKQIDPGYKRVAGGFEGADIQIHGCLGPVSVRSYATVHTASATSMDAITVYGDPQRIR
nr:MspA family porin [Corynebacterium uropygiale]